MTTPTFPPSPVSSRQVYDDNASRYDDFWTRHVLQPHRRLTEDLALRPGEKVVDLAAGPGVTLEMLRKTAPAAGVAVDPSRQMLDRGVALAKSEGLELVPVQLTAQAFLLGCEPESFDVLSLRFGLAYVDWENELASLSMPVRRGTGRVALLTNLASSAPQALKTYHAFMDELGREKAWPPVPKSTDQIEALLTRGDLEITHRWVEPVRIWFANGLEASDWLLQSGYIAGEALDAFPKDLLDMLKPIFASKLEADFGEDGRVPFDFDIAGVVARRKP
jgi:SAM-dependent methyltransferase